MIAKIRGKNGFYNSIVFAIYNKGWGSEVLVFNQESTALQFVKMWRPSRSVFIYNADKDGWIIKKKVEGYDWILENVTRKFFMTKISDKILDKCKELQATVKDFEWFDINNKTDVDSILYAAFDFHDSYIKNMYIDGEKQYILFDTTWGVRYYLNLKGMLKPTYSKIMDI